MDPPLSRRDVLALGSATGASLLAGCQGLGSGFTRGSSDSKRGGDGSSDSLGLVYSKSRTSFPSEETVHSGWVHIVGDGESADLTFDARFCSGLGEIEPEVNRSAGQEYVLRFDAATDLDGKSLAGESTAESACRSVTRLTGGANVPNDWETIVVTVDDTEVQTVEKSGTMPELRPLPDPIRFA